MRSSHFRIEELHDIESHLGVIFNGRAAIAFRPVFTFPIAPQTLVLGTYWLTGVSSLDHRPPAPSA